MVIGAGLSLLGANAAAGGVTKAGRYNKQIADRNAKVAEQKAELRLFRAEQDIVKFRSQYQTLAGQQEVQYNKANIMTGTGTALEVAMKSAANMRLQGQLKLFEAKSQAKAMRLQAMGKFAGSMASI